MFLSLSVTRERPPLSPLQRGFPGTETLGQQQRWRAWNRPRGARCCLPARILDHSGQRPSQMVCQGAPQSLPAWPPLNSLLLVALTPGAPSGPWLFCLVTPESSQTIKGGGGKAKLGGNSEIKRIGRAGDVKSMCPFPHDGSFRGLF